MQEQSFLKIGIICFWQNIVSFFESEKKKSVGKALEIFARPLGHGLCVTKHIFDELSVNQPKTDRLSFPCWLQNASGEVPLLNMVENLMNSVICKRVSKNPCNDRTEWSVCPFFFFFFFRMWLQLLGRKKKWTIPNQKQLQLSVDGGPEWKFQKRKRLVLNHNEFSLSLETHPRKHFMTVFDREWSDAWSLPGDMNLQADNYNISWFYNTHGNKEESANSGKTGKDLTELLVWSGSSKMFRHPQRRK